MRQVSGHSNSFQDPEDDDQDTIAVLPVEQSAATIADDEAEGKSKRERLDEPGYGQNDYFVHCSAPVVEIKRCFETV